MKPHADKRGHFVRVENTSSSGTLDLNYVMRNSMTDWPGQGWLELKVAHKHQVFIGKYQLAFSRTRLRATGGKGAWLLAYEEDIDVIHLFKMKQFLSEAESECFIGWVNDNAVYDIRCIQAIVRVTKPYKWGTIFDTLEME